MTALLLIFALLNLADGVITYKIIRAGGHEMMPVADNLIKRLGVRDALTILKVLTIAGIWWWAFNGLPASILAWMCAAFAAIVAWNFIQYRKGAKK